MNRKYNNLKVSEPIENVFVAEMVGSKSFKLDLIDELTMFFMEVFTKENKHGENRFCVYTGEVGSGVFNLGGDLSLFLELVGKKDILALQQYGRKCVDLLYKALNAKHSGMTTVAMINGDAKGGGFEGSLACDIIIAEEGYKIHLPEIKLGFFPGMGAFELLSKRIGPQKTKEFIMSGEEYTTEKMYEMGVFDFIVPKGKSFQKLEDIVKKERRMQTAFNSIRKIHDRQVPVCYDDLIHTVDLWVESILSISDADRRKIEYLLKKQNECFG